MRVAVLTIVLSVIGSAAEVSAEWHVKPFLGVTFAGDTTFVDVWACPGSVDGYGLGFQALCCNCLLS